MAQLGTSLPLLPVASPPSSPATSSPSAEKMAASSYPQLQEDEEKDTSEEREEALASRGRKRTLSDRFEISQERMEELRGQRPIASGLPVETFKLPVKRTTDWLRGPYQLQTHRWGHDTLSAKMEVERIRFDDNKVVVATHSNTIEIFHLETGHWMESLHGHADWVWDFAFNDQFLVSASCDHTLVLWQLSNHISNPASFLNRLNGGGDQHPSGAGANPPHHHHPDYPNYQYGSGFQSRQLQKYTGHLGWVQCVQFDNEKIVTGSGDQTLKIWDIETARCTHTLKGHLSFVYCLQYDQNVIVSGSGGLDKSIKIWDLRAPGCIGTLEGHTATVMCLNFRDNQVISGSFDTTIKLWDLRMKRSTNTLMGHSSAVGCVNFRPPSSRKLVSGSHDSTVKLWDLKTGALEHTISAHSGVVVGVQLKENGLVTCSVDKTVKRWRFVNQPEV